MPLLKNRIRDNALRFSHLCRNLLIRLGFDNEQERPCKHERHDGGHLEAGLRQYAGKPKPSDCTGPMKKTAKEYSPVSEKSLRIAHPYEERTIARTRSKRRAARSSGEIRKSRTPKSTKLRIKSSAENESISSNMFQPSHGSSQSSHSR